MYQESRTVPGEWESTPSGRALFLSANFQYVAEPRQLQRIPEPTWTCPACGTEIEAWAIEGGHYEPKRPVGSIVSVYPACRPDQIMRWVDVTSHNIERKYSAEPS